MSTPGPDVVAIGNALVDILSHEDDDFVVRMGLERGAATMVGAQRSEDVYRAMGTAAEVSGGSAANTAAGISSFGGSAAFIGRVADDTFGAVFAHDLRGSGVRFESVPASGGPPTGRCLVMVAPDAERTMCTYLGVAGLLEPGDIDEDLVASARVTYIEGYLWDQPPAKDAIRRAVAAAHRAGGCVALSLSDPFCVERHRAEFRALVEADIDLLFANEHEICSLYEVETFDEALQRTRGRCEMAALTRGAHGSVIVSGEETHVVDPVPVGRVVDTTGAGDLFAAGFLYGFTHDYGPPVCGRLGSIAAAEIISHLGARPETPLADLADVTKA